MLIKYNPKDEHIKIIPLVPVDAEGRTASEKGQFKRTQVRLLKGTNEVTDEEWAVMKPYLKVGLASGEVIVISKEVPKSKRAPDGKATSLKEMPAKEAAVLVAECINPDTLNKWYSEESRDEIRILIVEKMKELKMDPPKLNADVLTNNEGNGENSGQKTGKTLDEMTVTELKAYAAEKNITVSGNKDEILAAIKAAEGGVQ
jgi:hypothetical protein